MKNLALIIFLLFTVVSFSQEEQITNNKESDAVSFAKVENVPVYSGCDETLSNKELKDCMSTRIGNLVSRNFNIKLAKSLNLPAGKHRISIMFKVDKEGNVVGVRARAPHPELEKEAIRVVHLIPKLDKPGMQDGEAVIVPYGFPISFIVDETKPLSKKEQKKLERKEKRKS